jgi:hypothetical protein
LLCAITTKKAFAKELVATKATIKLMTTPVKFTELAPFPKDLAAGLE